MDKKQLTELLRPLIKKLIQEEISSPNGTLRKIITEVAEGLASTQLNLISEARVHSFASTAKQIDEKPSKAPSMHEMIARTKKIVGADQPEAAYVDINSKFKNLDPSLRTMLEHTQKTNPPELLEEGVEETPERNADGSINEKYASNPLRHYSADDPGIDLSMLDRIIKGKGK